MAELDSASLVSHLEQALGPEAYAAFRRSMDEQPPVSVRLNPFKTPSAPLPILNGARKVPWSPYGYILTSRPVFTLHPNYHAGAYYVQDSSAMFTGHIFRKVLKSVMEKARGRTLRVLDLCAAPGGKTTDLAASLRQACGDGFILVANEVMRQRASVLLDNTAVWGDPAVTVCSADPKAFARLEGYFDIILADVPCSGEGMFRKDPRALEEWSPQNVELCAARQRRILADVWPALAAGGRLIYSTCTFERSENDDNLKWAAQSLGGRIEAPGDEFGVRTTECGHLLVPGEVPGEGQWCGVLVREGEARMLAEGTEALQYLHPLRCGVEKGRMKGKDFIPSADWALSIDYDRSFCPVAELDKQTALHFLHKDSIVLPDAPKGYVLVTYRNLALGFVKNLGTRCNNLHPQSRRIRMDIE